jgi:hypothetical protein
MLTRLQKIFYMDSAESRAIHYHGIGTWAATIVFTMISGILLDLADIFG